MTDLRTAAQMALDALRETETYNTGNQEQYRLELDAMEALRAALSRPEPEPVADGIQVIEHVRNVQYKIKSRYHLENGTELYTAPPQREWKSLTDEEIDQTHETQVWDARRSYARAIEAKIKEKNA